MKKVTSFFLLVPLILAACKNEKSSDIDEEATSPLAIGGERSSALEFSRSEISTKNTEISFSETNNFKSIVINNTGTRDLTVSAISIRSRGNSFEVEQGSSCKENAPIQAKQSCIIDVAYQAIDVAQDAILTIRTVESNSIDINLVGTPTQAQQKEESISEYQNTISEEEEIRQAQAELSYLFADGESGSDENINPYFVEETMEEDFIRPIGVLAGNTEILGNSLVTPAVDNRRVVGAGTKIYLVLENTVRLGQNTPFTAYASYPVYGGYAPDRNRLDEPVLELIPKGTRFEGVVSQFSGTNNRLNLALTAMQTPMGNYIQFPNPIFSSSRDGSSGVVSRADYRWGERYAPGIVFNVVSAGVLNESGEKSVSGENSDLETSSGRTRALDQLAADAKALGKQITDDISNIAPRFYIPKATVIVVELSHQTGGLYFVSENEAVPLSAFGGKDEKEKVTTPQPQGVQDSAYQGIQYGSP